MELFELVGKITVAGVDNAKKSIESIVDSVKLGTEKISDDMKKISGMTDEPFKNKKTFKFGFEKTSAQNWLFDEEAIKISLDRIGRIVTDFYLENTEKLNSFKLPINIENFHEIDNAIKQVWDAFSNGNIANEIETMKNTVSEGMPQILEAQLDGLEKIYFRSLEKWHKIGASAAVGMSDMAKSIINGKSIVDSACSSVAGSALKNLMVDASLAGEYIMDTLDSGIYSKASQIYSTASSIASTISQTLSNITANVNISASSAVTRFPGHAKGGIVTREHIARVGEDGAEAIIPLEKNTQWIDRVAERLNGSSASNNSVLEKLSELNENIKNMKIYLDSGTLVGEIAPKMDKKLGSIARLKRRGAVT